jgi:hypothetical protein
MRQMTMSHTSLYFLAVYKKLYYPLTSDPVLFIYRETKDSTTAESGETILLNYADFCKMSCPISDFASFSLKKTF